MVDMSEGLGDFSETEADFPETSVSDKRIWNDWAPGNSQACRKAAELIMDTVRVGAEHGRALEYGGWCEDSCADLANDVRGGFNFCNSCGQKMVLPNTQSINRL